MADGGNNGKGVASDRVAVLSSGGLDSSVCLAQLARTYREVYPLYVCCGLYWEERERQFLRDFIATVGLESIREVQELELPMGDVYGQSWFASGKDIPGYHVPDEAWEIPGRNVILLAKASVWCRLHSVNRLALGSLASNPFSDATPDFFRAMEAALGQGLSLELKILRPLAGMKKPDVLRMGRDLPLKLTLSCARPEGDLHCGTCGKCRERINAFREAAVPDPTHYALRKLGIQ